MFGHSVGLVSEIKRVLWEDFPVICRRGFGTGDQCHLELVSILWEHRGVELRERYMCFGGWDQCFCHIWVAIIWVLKDKMYKVADKSVLCLLQTALYYS